MDDALPELFFVCGRCRTERRVADGVNPEDVAWLHERRCSDAEDGASPIAKTTCPSCTAEIVVPPGLTPIEAIWLHEDECAAIAAAYAYA
jgi:hypothetical protein